MSAAVRHKRSKEGFRKGELTRRVLEKVRDAAEPVRPMDVARAIMVERLMRCWSWSVSWSPEMRQVA
jgi:hypothetical protein